MSDLPQRPTTAAEQYAAAYATHYTERNLLGALRAYGQVIELHPTAAEAGYSRSQIQNIVNLVVPARELLASQTDLAARHLQRGSDEVVAAVSP
jgi:hypothetical protein